MRTPTNNHPHPMQELVDMLNSLFQDPPDGYTASYESEDADDKKEGNEHDTN